MESKPVQVKSCVRPNMKGRGNLYLVIRVSEMKPEKTRPKKLNMEIHETSILMEWFGYLSDSVIYPRLSMAATEDPHVETVAMKIRVISLLRRACKMLKSSPLCGFLYTFETLNKEISKISSSYSCGIKTRTEEFIVCLPSLKRKSSSLIAIIRGKQIKMTMIATPLA